MANVDPVAYIAATVRRERQRAELSLSELAKRAGLAKSTLSQVEAGTGNPSVETLWALSTTLALPLSRLVDPPPAVQTRVLRSGEGTAVHSDHADYSATLLATSPPHTRRDLYKLHVQPGTAKQSPGHAPGTI